MSPFHAARESLVVLPCLLLGNGYDRYPRIRGITIQSKNEQNPNSLERLEIVMRRTETDKIESRIVANTFLPHVGSWSQA